MALPGIKTIVHEKINNILSWAGHGTEAWYIGPSMDHYRCFKCYMPITCRERDAGTVEFFPTTTPFPRVSTDYYLRQAATDLVDILQAPRFNVPSLTYGSPTNNDYTQLAQILKHATSQPMYPTNKHPLASSPRAMPLLSIETKAPMVIPPQNLSEVDLNVRDKVAEEPMVQKVAPKNNNSRLLRYLHPLIQNKLSLLERLHPTNSRLTRLVRQAVHNSHPQAQSVQTISRDDTHWACPVFHPNTGSKLSLDQLLQGPDSPTWNTSLTN